MANSLKPWGPWISVAIWLALVGWVSLTPDPPGYDWLVALSRRFSSPRTALRAMQAILHVALYGVGAILIACAIPTIHSPIPAVRLFFLTLAVVMVVGIAFELGQDYVPRRRADLWDLSGDLVGTVLFLGAAWAAGRPPFKRSR